jgi:hypothetical protein
MRTSTPLDQSRKPFARNGRARQRARPFGSTLYPGQVARVSAGAALASFAGAMNSGSGSTDWRASLFGVATGLTVWAILQAALITSKLANYAQMSRRLARLGKEKPSSADKTRDDIPNQIERLGNLKEKGILTDQEFVAKKAELLRRM